MPELPEVETIKNDLKNHILHKPIQQVIIKKPKLIRSSIPTFKRTLIKNSFTDIDRVGKLLIFHLSSGQYLLTHLKMTGQLIYQDEQLLILGGHSNATLDTNLPHKHTHISFQFSDNSHLFYNDMRQFGYLQLVNESAKNKIVSQFGLNPLIKSFTPQALAKLIQSRRASIKSLLLQQQLIAGIGNIYADEACFLAGILPYRPANSLSKSEISKLTSAIKLVLKKSIKHRGTTFNNFRDSQGNFGNFLKFLQVYHRSGQACLRCPQGIIVKNKTAGRGTHFCSSCQQ